MHEKYNSFSDSLLHNLGEFCEFVVGEFDIANYYDLVYLMIDLHNFKAEVYENDKELAIKIIEKLEKEKEKEIELPKLTLVEEEI